MSIQATNVFHTKPGRADELLATLKRVLPDTLTHGGCEEIYDEVLVVGHDLRPQ